MAGLPRDIWRPNTPDSLLTLATRFCVHHKGVFTRALPPSPSLPPGSLALQEGLHLPVELCEQLLLACQQEGGLLDDATAHIFSDLQNCRVRQVHLADSAVTDLGLRSLLAHSPRSVHLTNCERLGGATLETLNEFSDNLVSLAIVNTSESEQQQQVLPLFLDSESPDSDVTDDEEERVENRYTRRRYILRAPRLRSLTVRELYVVQGRDYFHLLVKALPNLTHLDLSGVCHSQGGLAGLRFLLNCPHLVSLVLHNVKEVKEALLTLSKLDRLEHLDISQLDELYGDFASPSLYLEELVRSLPRLRSLDLSGTNLGAGYREGEGKGRSDGLLCDLPGLARRVHTPLDFLGLYHTKDEACRREHIPALQVSGNHSEQQLLLAGARYLERPLVMEQVIDDMVQHVRMDGECDLQAALALAARCMEKHARERKLLRHTSALVYYLLESSRLGHHPSFSRVVRQRLLGLLLGVMRRYREDGVLMRNGCMVLWRFDPDTGPSHGKHEDLLLQYPAVVDTLLYVGEHYTAGEENYTQRAAVFLLNQLVCQVDGEQKVVRGVEIVEGMLRIVRQKLQHNTCDDVMETAWSVMWNVTDETPGNSQRFLDDDGMEVFLQCKEAFPDKPDLLRNMMGLLGNIAEVRACRRRLMFGPFVAEFSFLLDSSKDGIEVSYNAAGVLSHLASDGPGGWSIQEPSREHVLERLVRAVSRWDVQARRDINYRSLAPIIGLLACHHTPECQLWAAWALANLTQWEEAKYCPLVDREGGLLAIQGILAREVTCQPNPLRDKLLLLGKVAVRNIEAWRRADGQVEAMVRD